MLENNAYGLELYNPIEKALVENNSLKSALDDKNLSGMTVLNGNIYLIYALILFMIIIFTGSLVRSNPVEDLQNDLQKEIDFIYKDITNLILKIESLKAFSSRLDLLVLLMTFCCLQDCLKYRIC